MIDGAQSFLLGKPLVCLLLQADDTTDLAWKLVDLLAQECDNVEILARIRSLKASQGKVLARCPGKCF